MQTLNLIQMKRFYLTICLIAMTLGFVTAGPVDQTKAQRVAEKFLATTSLGQQKTAIELNLVYTMATRGAVDYYIFNVKGNNGFVVVAGDDRVKPILAYATTGKFVNDDIADGFSYTLRGYQEEINYVRDHNLAVTSDIKAEWNRVETTGYVKENRNTRTVDILCSTLWNQNYPYNSLCPEEPEGNGGHVYAGCVATAMGQVLYFWNHPVQGTGSHSYTPGGWGYPSYPTQTANFGETEYHWEDMPLQLDSTSTEEEIFPIAQVLSHLGISVDMMYSGSGSGAYSDDVPDALYNYFGFSRGQMEYKWGGNSFWMQTLKGELDQNRPLYYSGSDDAGNGGHAFVCDGYDENDFFHFNWGWDGRDNAWCALGALNTTKYAFNQMNGCISNLYPRTEEYNQRPEKIQTMELIENAGFNGAILEWTNPVNNNGGNALASLSSIVIRRNMEVIATLNGNPGETMRYEDLVPADGLYEYSIFATNESGNGIPLYQRILIGEKCDVIVEMNDEGGDGWKGAAISVADEAGNRIAVITMTEGSQETNTVPLIKGNLHFIWNHGWYHNSEEYDTDYECSYTIYDMDGNEIYTSPETLEDGIFITYNNNCDGTLACHAPENLVASYTWNGGFEYGITLEWQNPSVADHLDHFVIYRSIDGENFEPLHETTATENPYTYFDDLSLQECRTYYYRVTSIFIDGDDSCESEPAEAEAFLTEINEMAPVAIYPNPTTGNIRIECNDLQQVTVFNALGQMVYNTACEGQNVTFNLNESGIYTVKVITSNGESIQKVSVIK